jgi:hypothetical protein
MNYAIEQIEVTRRRPVPACRDRRSERRADGADGHPPGNQHADHAVRPRDRSWHRGCGTSHGRCSGGLACISQDSLRSPQCYGRPRDRRERNASGHHEDNRCGRRVSRRCARSLGHARGCGTPNVVDECQSLFQSFRKRPLAIARALQSACRRPAQEGFHLAFTDSLNFT